MQAFTNIDRQLDHLENQYRRMITILAWDDLAQAETDPTSPPGFTLQTGIRESLAIDLQDAEAVFNQIAEGIVSNLRHHDSTYSSTQMHEWHTRLNQLLDKYRGLHLENRY